MAAASFFPGHVFADRFRILEVIGVGHTAEVYLAHDDTLQRQVVVKCLTRTLELHEEVRRSFRSHIVRAAGIQHAHLARVFDGGQQDGGVFMVAEYLAGGSLEEQLQRGRRLSVTDAARLGRDCASALAVLHDQGIVHGELAPTKLLFDSEGSVRISDIAMANLGVAFRTYQTGDDVRYFSPEQAQGLPAGPETDVYALALILFEAVTGQRPFEGFTAEATLRARMVSPLPSHPELGTLDLLLAHATVPDPTQRLSASAFADRLSTIIADNDDFVLTPSAPTTLLTGLSAPGPRQSVGFRPPSPLDITGAAPVVSSTPQNFFDEPLRRSAPRDFASFDTITRNRRRRPGYLVAAIALVVIAGGVGTAWKLGYLTTKHTVPALEGLTVSQASGLVKGDGLTLQITGHQNSSTVAANEILSQTPAPGSSIVNGGTLSVVLSSGTSVVNLPASLIGASCTADIATLKNLHVTATCPTTAVIRHSSVGAGLVAAVYYQSTVNPLAVPAGASVTLFVSAGPPAVTTTTTATGPRPMPNLVGDNQAQVGAALHQAGLYYSTRGPGHGTSAWKRVVSTLPAAGTMVPWHSTVILNVDEG